MQVFLQAGYLSSHRVKAFKDLFVLKLKRDTKNNEHQISWNVKYHNVNNFSESTPICYTCYHLHNKYLLLIYNVTALVRLHIVLK